MPRDHARVNLTIWSDPDFRALPPPAQHLYLMLWTAPELSYCGVHDWRPGRITGLAHGLTVEHIETVAACLEARHFFVIDRDTEECLIRSWARFDGLMKSPVMAVSFANAYAATASEKIRQVLVHEAHKIHAETPDSTVWKKPKVAEILTHPSASAKDLDTPEDPFNPSVNPWANPSVNPSANPWANPPVEGQPNPSVNPSPNTPPTPAPTPATKPLVVKGGVGGDDETRPKKRQRTLDEDWQPTASHVEYAATHELDLSHEVEQFRNHALANDRRQVDWGRAFSTWLGNSAKWKAERATRSQPPRDPRLAPGENPDDWMRRTL